MTNNYPEMFIDESGRRIVDNEEIAFAPADETTQQTSLMRKTGISKVGLPFTLMGNTDYTMKEE